jgi:hypothetical protein
MSRLQHFAYPHGGGWCVAYVVPGTPTMHVVCVCRSYEEAAREARRLSAEAEA